MKSKEARRWKVALGVSLVTTSLASYAYYCPDYQDSWVLPQFFNATSVLNAAVKAVDTALSAQLLYESERLTAAIAILTKQKAVAGNQIGDSSRTAAQQVATGLKIHAEIERLKKARLEFGGDFGQGYEPCLVEAKRQAITSRDADMDAARRDRVTSEVTAAPGRYVDPIKGRRDQIEANKDSCTADQVASGLCQTEGTMPGASLNIATLFEPAMEGEPLYKAKVAFIDNMVGPPNGMVPKAAGKTPATEAYSLAKARKDAVASPAIVSLKEIQLDYSGVSGAHTDMDIPLAMHFRNEVARYSGNSPEYDAWAKKMAGQKDRGVLVELLKIKALDLVIQAKQYRQYERMEAQLAALVALNTAALQESSDNAASLAAKQNAMEAIK